MCADVLVALPLVCECPRLFAALVPSSPSPSAPAARNKNKAFIIIFDSTLRPTRTTGEHTTPSCPQNDQNCLMHRRHMNMNVIFTHISISLSVNQAEALSHVQAVCFGHGALKWADVVCARVPPEASHAWIVDHKFPDCVIPCCQCSAHRDHSPVVYAWVVIIIFDQDINT